MSTSYLVSIDMQLSGNSEAKVGALAGKVGGLESAVGRAGAAFAGMGSQLSDAFTGAVEKVGSLAMGLAKIGVVTGVAAAVYGVASLNRELESTRISLGAIFNAQGVVGNIGEGMTLASTQMEKMREDAAALPGEFDDLKRIMTTIATPALASGMTVDQLRAMSAQTMAVGAVMGIQSDQTAREMAMLLEGRAGGHNVLGMRLGFMGQKAHALKEASPEKRNELINSELKKYQPAIAEFGKSFDGLWTSSMSNVKKAWGEATKPLFETVELYLGRFNRWWDDHKLEVTTFAQALGSKLAYAWEVGAKAIDEWWPAIRAFSVNLYDKISTIWTAIQPYVERFGTSLQEALKDPGTIDKLMRLLELYAAIKIGGGAMGLLGIGAGGVGGALGAVGGMAGSALTGAAAVGGMEVGGALTAMVSGASAASASAAAWGAAMLPLVAVVGSAAAAGTALWAVFDQGSKLYSEVHKDNRADAIAWREAIERNIEAAGVHDATDAQYQITMHRLIDAGEELQASLLLVAGEARETANFYKEQQAKRADAEVDFDLSRLSAGTIDMVTKQIQLQQTPPKHPGNPGINIAKVEISVTSNNEPSRVAALVMDKLSNLRKHPRSSPDVTNFASAMR